MPSLLQKLRNFAYSAQHGRCIYCNAYIWNKNPGPFMRRFGVNLNQARRFQCTAEHLRARSAGGKNAAENIVAACVRCNSQRHRRKNPPEPSAYQCLVRRRVAAGKWHPPWAFEVGLIEKR